MIQAVFTGLTLDVHGEGRATITLAIDGNLNENIADYQFDIASLDLPSKKSFLKEVESAINVRIREEFVPQDTTIDGAVGASNLVQG